MKCSSSFLAFSLLLLSLKVLAWGEDKFCTIQDVKSGKCSKGDLLYVPSPIAALKLCDFDKKIVTFSKGDASSIYAVAICFYSGSERERK